ERLWPLPSLVRQNTPATSIRPARRTSVSGFFRQNRPSILRQNSPAATTYDWQQFKADRNFYEKQPENSGVIEWTPQTDAGKLENANDLLNSIENEELLAVLEKVDKLTLEMLAMQMLGYSTPQICCRFNVTAYSYYNRIKRLKEKLKKFFRSD
ncbi:hypothetical protein, partial [Ruthenibacterium lactatiformans]|uniref:hypothetical protein n=2 Tax=Ruthenibacterium lactatiformans TaxID=1550024 RepID=UPI003AAA9F6D